MAGHPLPERGSCHANAFGAAVGPAAAKGGPSRPPLVARYPCHADGLRASRSPERASGLWRSLVARYRHDGDTFGAAGVGSRSRTPAPSRNSTPAAARARSIAARVAGIGDRASVSNLLMVATPTRARVAKSLVLQVRAARAIRDCAGVII